MLSQTLVNIVYLVAAVLFILGLKWMSHPRTAVRGNAVGALGMLLAIVRHPAQRSLRLALHPARRGDRLA